MKKKKILIVLFLFLTSLFSGFLYRDSFKAYFFQDDWFTLRISQAKNLAEFLNFFVPRTDVIYYRPLGMQVPFFALSRLFGVNPLPFHFLIFLTHTTNIFLVFILIRLLSRNIFVALFSSFLYATSMVHFTPFFWSSTYPFILGPTFFFLSMIFFLEKKLKSSFFVYLLGVLTNELVLILPVILLIYKFLFIQKEKRRGNTLGFYFLITAVIVCVRLFLFPPSIGGDYKIEFGRYLVNNLRAYFLWSFNWPEEIKDQFVSFFNINSQFIKDFRVYFWIFLITFWVNFFFFYLIPLIIFLYRKKFIFLKKIILGVIWFLIGLLPVLFFPKHTFSYYLPISFVGLLFFSTILFHYSLKIIFEKLKILSLFPISVLMFNWIFSSFYTLDFNLKVHWAPRRAKIAENLITKVHLYYPYRGLDYPNVYVRPYSENKLALNDQDALRVIFGDNLVKTIYQYTRDKESI